LAALHLTVVCQYDAISILLQAQAASSGGGSNVNSPIIKHIDNQVDVAVSAPAWIFVGHQYHAAFLGDVAGRSILDQIELAV